MSDAYKPEAGLAASLLQAATSALPAGLILLALAGGGLLLAATRQSFWAGIFFALSMAGGPALLWYGLRIRFDVDAFRLIAQGTITLTRFDEALQRLQLRKENDDRDLPQRAQAARRLITRLFAVIVWQWAFFVTGSASLYVV
jgi:hypothetical protein